MSSTKYSHTQSHERHMSPQEAGMAARNHTLKASVDYLHAVVSYTDPEALTQTAGSVNVAVSPEVQPRTSSSAVAANAIAFTGQEQLLADARRQAAQEAL